jgi:acetyl-CoA carboxylase biotin carboxyl carrier protein
MKSGKKAKASTKSVGAPQSLAKATRSNSLIDLESVKDLSEFMAAQGLVEFNFKQGAMELHLRRAESSVGNVPMIPSQVAMQNYINGAANAPTASASPVAKPAAERPKNHHLIKSPFVGTFYRSAGPNQDSFVEEGKTIDAGDTLCIIEAMKLMNEIESDIKGRIVKILVTNETPVEFGEALFEIEAL